MILVLVLSASPAAAKQNPSRAIFVMAPLGFIFRLKKKGKYSIIK